MENETLEKLAVLTARIKELPKGYISKKTIGGKVYYYHQADISGMMKWSNLRQGWMKEKSCSRRSAP